MSALVQLHRDPISGEGEHLGELPEWLPPTGTYWHTPRSAYVRLDGRVVVSMWCGQVRYYPALAIVSAVVTPPPQLRCGTCAGRRAGASREAGLIFSPRDHWALPAVCPCTTPDPADLRLCLACGRRTNAARGWYAYGLARHAPVPELADRCEPCPRHGWSRAAMRADPDRLFCWAHDCGYEMGPR